ncbi:MAG: 3-ketoacyl-ACP reductase [Planctomycetota bacterium]|nr:3-ketoacyl-ACP reductase [Planctomycetota bacterium]
MAQDASISRSAPRTAIVTGGSRGIGRAIAVALGQAGARVVINYFASRDAALEAATEIEQAGGQAMTVQADVSSPDGRARMLEEAQGRFGAVDLLVNNAGIAPKVRADLLETSEESFDDLLATNLKGPFFLSQAVARQMIARRDQIDPAIAPAIINISSISAYTASVNRGEYCISKAGIAMMTQLFASRLAEHGINVYEVRPGVIATDMTGPVKAKYDKLILEDGLLPIRRWGQPSDVAKAVVAIAEGAFPYSTGQVLDVDGGFHIRRL